MTKSPAIVWFRNDLRLRDHRALSAAVASGAPLILLYVLDDESPGEWKPGGASRWWLHRSLEALQADIVERGGALTLRRGNVRDVIPALVRQTRAASGYMSRAYEPWAVAVEHDLKRALDAAGIALKRYGGALLREPEEVKTKAGEPFKVYTPFWRALADGFKAPAPVAAPATIPCLTPHPKSDTLQSWKLRPARPDWAAAFEDAWTPGEDGATARLEDFLDGPVARYAEDRNHPDRPGTSRLSAHLHFGEITPARCWSTALAKAGKGGASDKGTETFLKELVWREFSYSLLFHWPDLPRQPFREDFKAFPWRANADALKAWQKGKTGYPIVDAGMRELWATGYMHNRVRMIVASFLIKDLLIPWQAGEEWFWDTLVDADLASNAASWQWVAGCGADAAPYFRIFNPVTQGEKFDPDGTYVRRWVPELARLPSRFIHAPWTAPADVLKACGIVIGATYPQPIVDHAKARSIALEAFAALKK